MKPDELLKVLDVAQRLKTNTRHCWFKDGRRESVAEHCWRVALMAMLMEKDFPQADMNKVIKMCLIHDMGECFTGDIPTFEKTEKNCQTEKDLLIDWVKTFPQDEREQWLNLYDEMEKLESLEAKIYKALDKMEAVISHNESDIKTWLPLEYDLQLTYGQENVQFSDYMKKLKSIVNEKTRIIMEESKKGGEI